MASAAAATVPAARVCVIFGAGSKWDKDGAAVDIEPRNRFGLGGALALKFAAEGYHVVACGRRKHILDGVVALVQAAGGAATAKIADVTLDASVREAFDTAKGIGAVKCTIFNVGMPMPPKPHDSFFNMPKPHECDIDHMTRVNDVGFLGCVRVARSAVPIMLENGGGTILISGATLSLRGGAGFACMAPTKAALRSFSQSLWNAYSQEGIHTAHVIIDGVIDSPGTREFGMANCLDCGHLAQCYYDLDAQSPTVWSHEIQLNAPKGSLGMRL